jgi:pyruvate formate lyase activating enzyme
LGHPLSKRDFLKLCGKCLCAVSTANLLGPVKLSHGQGAQKGLIKVKESPYYKVLNNSVVQCELCPRQCHITEKKRGFCGVRENRNGRLYSLVYGNPCVIHLDPVEKEPFFHILPGSNSLTLSTVGCNFQCLFCENWEIARAQPEDVFSYDIPPSGVIKKAIGMNARSVSFTYAEPIVFYEYMLDVAYLSKKAGLLNYIHTNGFINPEPLRDLCEVLDAAQVDLKGFTEAFYDELTGGELSPVLKSLKILKEKDIHLEITNLIIPTKNDNLSGIREMCQWIKKELGPDTPLHFHRFYPLYRLQRIPSTPVSILEKARSIALKTGLKYVYIGKIPGHEAWNTFCPSCKKTVIQRTGYMIGEMNIKEGRCEYCGEAIYGKWN